MTTEMDDANAYLDRLKQRARLNAAAPDLLAACEQLIANVERAERIGSSGTLNDSLADVRAAIAQAKGE